MKQIKKFFDEIEIYIGTVLLFIMFLLLNIQVLSRHLFDHSLTWTEELSTIIFVWLGYLGASAAVYKQQHLRIDVLLNVFKGNAKKMILILTDMITMVFCVIMIFPMIDVIEHLARLHSATLILRLPMDLIYWVLPFALALQAFRFVQDIIRIIRTPAHESLKVSGKTIFDDEEENT